MDVRDHPYAPFLHEVKKPAQYLGGEHGERRKEWDAVEGRLCLAFPDLYEIGMSHLGFKILYGILNEHPKLLAERAYAPWPDMEAKLREHGEQLRSLESARPLRDFDVVGFSLQFELTYSNILLMLDTGGIPLFASERGDDDPLVVAGGPTATHPEPLTPFVDAFLIGDGEEKTPELLLTWAALKKSGMPRRKRLEVIASLGGWYVPSLYRTEVDADTGLTVVAGPADDAPEAPYPVQRAIVRDLSKYPFPSGGPVAATETIFDRVSIEIARGCTEGCRFCQAGMIYRPVRERDPQHIIDTLVRAVKDGGYDEASLTSLSTADYSAIEPLVHEVTRALRDEPVNVSVSSLRAYGLSEAVLDDMKTQRAGGLTFAPEAGSQRMRDVVNKNVTEAQLMETAERVFSRGWSKMKLYFMIGLPTEVEEDVREIVRVGARAKAVADQVRGKRDGRVTVSVSSFVPKPHTPFQWCAMNAHDLIVEKQGWLHEEKKAQSREKRTVQLKVHESNGSWLEGVLARGDRRLGPVLASAYAKGARFDSWDEGLKLDAWTEAFAEHGVDTAPYLGTFPVSARLPWDHLDVGLEEGFLAKEYRKALKNRLSPPCGKVAGTFVHHTNVADADGDARRLVCYDCGVACDMGDMRGARLVKLDALGAKAPRKAPSVVIREAAQAELVAAGEDPARARQLAVREAARKQRELDRRPMRAVDQGEPLRVRLGFRKVGRIAFSSHLDLVRLFPRWFRRAELPLFYSEGFHPKAQMTFGPALGLGNASLGEYVDVKLRGKDVSAALLEGLEARLRETALEGVELFGARVLGNRRQDAPLGRVLDEATWAVGLHASALDAAGLADVAALEARVAERRAAPLFARRDVKGIGKRIDVAKVLADVRVGAGMDALRRAGIAGELVPLTFSNRLPGDGTARPVEVLRALVAQEPEAGDDATPAGRIVRTGLHARRGDARVSPLDLEALRQAPDATEPSATASAHP